jgi:hypothetical protein
MGTGACRCGGNLVAAMQRGPANASKSLAGLSISDTPMSQTINIQGLRWYPQAKSSAKA